MKINVEFQEEVLGILNTFDKEMLSYNHDEFWMVESVYEYIEFYAIKKKLLNTSLALQLARGLHDGAHRKLCVEREGQSYRLPYLIHPLLVCRMLLDLHANFTSEEEDILLATALCHDMIEDIPFAKHGKELYEDYHLDYRVYENVTYLSKRYDFTEEQEQAFFHNIESHEIALLVKLSDRGNNVEDLYNMKFWKVNEYVEETDKFFLPMCDYAFEHYPQRRKAFEILRDKICVLTDSAQILFIRYDDEEQKLLNEVRALRQRNTELKNQWKALWKED